MCKLSSVDPTKSFRHRLPLDQHYPVEINTIEFLQNYVASEKDRILAVMATDVFNGDIATALDSQFITLNFMPQQYIWVYPQTFSGVVELVIYGISVSLPASWPMKYEFLRIPDVPFESIREINLILYQDFQIRETTI